MVDKFQHLLERHPENEKLIRGLVEVSPEFRALVEKHHEVSERLHAGRTGSPPDSASDETQRLEGERKSLEERLALMMSDRQRT